MRKFSRGPFRSAQKDASEPEGQDPPSEDVKDVEAAPVTPQKEKTVVENVDVTPPASVAGASHESPVVVATPTVPSHPVRRLSESPTAFAGESHKRNNSTGNAPEFQTHLRKMTGQLMDIIEQMSSSTTRASSLADSEPVPRRQTTALTSRHDSVATIVDLEAQKSAPPEEVVPTHHVRRLTSTLVDILRHVATTTNKDMKDAQEYPSEGAALLNGDNASEYSADDRSLASSAAISQMSAQTALLKAQYMPQQEYKGDEVRPFYYDWADDRYLPTVDKLAAYSLKLSDIGEEISPNEGGMSEVEARNMKALDCSAIPQKHKKEIRINKIGLSIFVFYCIAFIMYIFIRATKTLGLGPLLVYGIIVLLVEILGGIAMLPYGLCLCARVVNNKAPAPDEKGIVATVIRYHIRVIIPCYKEPLDVISKTVMASLFAALPSNCRRTVYLCDDGRDNEKKQFIRSLQMSNAVYISGRKRAKGEMNGKSANINNAMKLIYPEGSDIPLNEVVCVFDADQVPNGDFFQKTVPLLDGGQDVAMVLSPQTFYNLNANGDIFNHSNVHFWDYTQPGYDALGLISCTGTNFLLRSKAFHSAGWFPEWTLTEDFALGIELKKRGWQCRYVSEYLAIGEAPEEVRNCFQQRSRWSKGHFQVFCSKHNPVFNPGGKGLGPLMRWMYGSVILSYFSAFLATPLLMLVPMLTVWIGAFPIVINFWAALSITVFYVATLGINYYTRSPSHLKSMWFASVANNILWWAFFKAMYRSTLGRWIEGTIVFKVTAKGLQRMKDLPIRDIWMSMLWTIAMLVSLILGLVHFFKGGVYDTPLAISLIWLAYNLIPQYLLLQYAAYNGRRFFNVVCKITMLLSTACAITGIVLIWVLYPTSYDYSSTLTYAVSFYNTQRLGTLPENYPVAWRSSAFIEERSTKVFLAPSMPNGTFGFGVLPLEGGSSAFSYEDPFAYAGGDPFSDPFSGRKLLQTDGGNFDDLFGGTTTGGEADPFAAAGGTSTEDPLFATDSPADSPSEDPFAAVADSPADGEADPFAAAGGTSTEDPLFATDSPADSPSEDPFAAVADSPADGEADPFAAAGGTSTEDPLFATDSPADSPSEDPFAAVADSPADGEADPFAAAGGTSTEDPLFATDSPADSPSEDPFAAVADSPADGEADPFAAAGGTSTEDPLFATDSPADSPREDPFAATSDDTAADPFTNDSTANPLGSSTASDEDPFASASTTADPFGAASASDPFNDPFSASTATGLGSQAKVVDEDWDLEGGFMSGMAGGNIKATAPIAFSTSVLAWSLLSFPEGFEKAEAVNTTLDNVRWAADYLMKVQKGNSIITRVGDIDTEMMLWYRPEESTEPRDAYAVDIKSGAADLGGSVAAALAASSMLFKAHGDDAYAKTLLNRSQEVYEFAKLAEGLHTDGDYNLTLLYNASTYYDDLAWAAGWLYKATQKNEYMLELYDHYSKHIDEEGEIADWKRVFDWDNVFYAVNVLMAQETGTRTFSDQSEEYLRSWVCANNVANYTQRGRAYNPNSGSLGATANTAMLALMYADVAEATKPDEANTYRCWALSQLRYILGDSGNSMVVGVGHKPPQRTQDRNAGCPKEPQVCNRVTGLLSPDPDSHDIDGALIYGVGKSDYFIDERRRTSNWIGIENNAGFVGALSGAALLPGGQWEVCLQEFGIVRSNPVCGSFLQI